MTTSTTKPAAPTATQTHRGTIIWETKDNAKKFVEANVHAHRNGSGLKGMLDHLVTEGGLTGLKDAPPGSLRPVIRRFQDLGIPVVDMTPSGVTKVGISQDLLADLKGMIPEPVKKLSEEQTGKRKERIAARQAKRAAA